MGFLALPGMTDDGVGNFAILDAVEALKWVNKNIAAFGGDPGQVTIAGQSAGSRTSDRDVDAIVQGPFPTRDHALKPHGDGAAGQAELCDPGGEPRDRRAGVRQTFSGKTWTTCASFRWKRSTGMRGKTADVRHPSNMYAVIDGKVLTQESVDLQGDGALDGATSWWARSPTNARRSTAHRTSHGDPGLPCLLEKATGRRALCQICVREAVSRADAPLDAYRQHLKAQADMLLEQNRLAGSLLSARNPRSKVYVFYFDHPTPGRDRESLRRVAFVRPLVHLQLAAQRTRPAPSGLLMTSNWRSRPRRCGPTL